MEFSFALFMLKWSIGAEALLWLTGRHRLTAVGYSLISRVVFASMALLAYVLAGEDFPEVKILSAAVFVVIVLAAAVGYRTGNAVTDQQALLAEGRRQRVAEMVDPTGASQLVDAADKSPQGTDRRSADLVLDVVCVAVGAVGLWYISRFDDVLGLVRVITGGLMLGAALNAMLLGHWYLTQPGLPRSLLVEQVRACGLTWGIATLAYLFPTGMINVWAGEVNDGYGGLLGWFWAGCVVTGGAMIFLGSRALKERNYAAVMATTGLLYLVILMVLCEDLLAASLLAP